MNLEEGAQHWLAERDSPFSIPPTEVATTTAESWGLPPAEFLEPYETGEWIAEDTMPAGLQEAWATEEPHEDLVAELLAEDALATSLTETLTTPYAEEPASEQFIGIEHKVIGDLGSDSASSIIWYGSPPKTLTFGEVVALAGDYVGDYGELIRLSLTVRLAWARWHCLSGPGFTEPEPQVDDAVKKAVLDRYYQLAAENFSHFSAGGTAWLTYTTHHAGAITAALGAGLTGKPQQWQDALTREAFADHFLTDSFAAGHIRTPRSALKQWYGRAIPGGAEPFVRYMARFMYQQLDAQGRLNWLLRHLEGTVRHTIETKIRKLGGEALATFGLGDIVSKALHDYDNNHGLAVVSDLDADGKPHPGGYPWTAMGDWHLADKPHGEETRAMAVAAVKASIRDLRKVRDTAARLDNRQLSAVQRIQLLRQVLGTPLFEARHYIPRERVGDPHNKPLTGTGGDRAPLEWRWGQLGPVAYEAIDAAVRGDIARELQEKSHLVDDSVTRLGMTVTGIRAAFTAFVQHLQQQGITAIEAAVGRKAR